MPPPVPPRPVGTLLYKHSNPHLVIECFLDYNCPYSGKMFNMLYNEVMPAFKTDPRVDMLFQNVPQPWHPQSCYQHEAGMAVKLVDESKFYAASSKIFAAQDKFADKSCIDMSRNQCYDSLADIVTDGTGVDRQSVMDQLKLDKGDTSIGHNVTLMIKFSAKYHRVRGVHVTPTVFLNGVEAPDVGSGWTAEQWKEKITACLENSKL